MSDAATRVKARKVEGVQRILNCLPSAKQEEDWGVESAKEAGMLAARAALPEKVDLRESWWKVGDQGSTGSCVGWATADSVLRWHLVRAGRLSAGERLSVRFVWMAAKETDEFINRPTSFIEADGTSLKAALDITRKYGAVTDKQLPFDKTALYAGKVEPFYLAASQNKIGAYVNLGRDLDDWRRWLATGGPILTRLDCDDSWFDAKASKGELKEYHPPAEPAGHAVALVGYDANYFIVRNSWGTTNWGDKGFGYATNEYAEAAFTEAYGITL